MRQLSMTMCLVIACCAGSAAQDQVRGRWENPDSVILQSDEDCPISTTKYVAESYTDAYGDGIKRQIAYGNASTRTTVAVKFVFVDYDVWNEHLFSARATLVQRLSPPDGDDPFILPGFLVSGPIGVPTHALHCSFAWVDQVRFEDGEIWVADRGRIAAQIREHISGFQEENLTPLRPAFPVPSA